jgi:hypothetical protein
MRMFRRRILSRTLAVLLLLAAASGTPHGASDDPACALPAGGSGDSPVASVETVSAADHDHCAVCHWTRSLRSPLVAGLLSDMPLAAGAAVPPGIIARRVSADLVSLPARAPPVSLAAIS